MMERRKQCEVDGRYVRFCGTMSDCLEGTNGHRKGVTSLHTMNFKTREEGVRGAILKSGDHLKKGIMMNFCPFCGVEIIRALDKDRKGGDGGE